MSKPRLALLPDYMEEGWPSMDICAEMLLAGLQRDHRTRLAAELIRPPYRRRFERLSARGRNVDRLLNRFCDYPRALRRAYARFDLFHLVDHSYAQLLHELPLHRTGIYCHDLDTFNCLLNPEAEPRPRWFRAMVGRILRGFAKAAVIFHSTNYVRTLILQYQLADPSRLIHAPLGIAEEFHPLAPEEPEVSDALLPTDGRYVLHVGSGIARKRIDVLLDVFAAVRSRHPDLRLIQVGGPWTAPQRQQIKQLCLSGALIQLRNLRREQIAALYRNAAVVLQPSQTEGFGLPVIEALACGAPVLASDIPVFREVGDSAACFAPVGDVDAWAQSLDRLLNNPEVAPSQDQRLRQASRYSWSNHCRIIADTYERLSR